MSAALGTSSDTTDCVLVLDIANITPQGTCGWGYAPTPMRLTLRSGDDNVGRADRARLAAPAPVIRLARPWLVGALLLGACASPGVPVESVAPLEPIDAAEVEALLDVSAQPIVLNVWASWCTPCRSEAPLLRAAEAEWGDRIKFLGIDVRDSQAGARAFIAEFGLDAIEHRFDARGAVPAGLGAGGVPLTFFFRSGGELIHLHRGVLDERTLALFVDDLLKG